MAIKKQEFYEGAALHALARSNAIRSIQYQAPFFLLDGTLLVHLKYSTKGRSPWGFTFTPDEQSLLQVTKKVSRIVVGLICGADGVATLQVDELELLARPRESAVRISCFRQHREHYEICGPDGQLRGKVAPSDWLRILEI